MLTADEPLLPADDTHGSGRPVIELDDVWATFRVFTARAPTLRDRLSGGKNEAVDHTALRSVDLVIRQGEAVAIVGPNGSGKSTLLKLLARIFAPSRGTLTVRGRVAPMLELGAGFHGDLSGRENVYLNAAILGFSEERVDAVFDDIVAFSELSDYIDRPVRTYSSGMYLRLGFAVSVHLEPDVLLIDEVLSVGDAAFATKCLDRIRELQRRGVTIVIVSHDLATIETLCDKAVYLNAGEIRLVGACSDVLSMYRSDVSSQLAEQPAGSPLDASFGTGEVRIEHLSGPVGAVEPGGAVDLEMATAVTERVVDPSVSFVVRSADGVTIYETSSVLRGERSGVFEPGDELVAACSFAAALVPGTYRVACGVTNSDGSQVFHWLGEALTITVTGSAPALGLVDLGAEMSVVGGTPSTAESDQDGRATLDGSGRSPTLGDPTESGRADVDGERQGVPTR